MNRILQTNRILLNSYTPDDQAGFIDLVQDPAVMRYVGGPKLADDAEKLFQGFMTSAEISSDIVWAIRKKDDLAYVGHAALFKSDVCRAVSEREILFYIHKMFWKNGFGCEAGKLMIDFAFTWAKFERIWATVDLDHEASRKVCEKIGMNHDRIGSDEQGDFLILRCEPT